MKRKALTITLAAVMAMGTCAVTASAADGDKYTIGICQLVQHEALDAATQGFKDEIVKELGEDAVTFDEQNAQGDSNTCSTIINSFVSNNEDLILANATASLQAAAAGTSDIPILGTAVTEYGVALDLKDFDGTVGGNISGTSDLAPLDEQAAMLQELFPDAKKVGLLYCSAEANSQYQVDTVKLHWRNLDIHVNTMLSPIQMTCLLLQQQQLMTAMLFTFLQIIPLLLTQKSLTISVFLQKFL